MGQHVCTITFIIFASRFFFIRAGCPDPSFLQNVNMLFSQDLEEGSVLTYTCKQGYRLGSFRSQNVCLSPGRWVYDHPRCLPIPCESPPLIIRGSRDKESGSTGDEITYTCDDGFRVKGQRGGSVKLICQNDGKWSGSFGEEVSCVEIGCDIPQNELQTVEHEFDLYWEGGVLPEYEAVIVKCKDGSTWKEDEHRNKKEINIICQEGGYLSQQWPECRVAYCAVPRPFSNGQTTSYNVTLGFSITITCDAGSTMFSSRGYREHRQSKRLTCINHQQWSKPIPTCKANCLSSVENGNWYTYSTYQWGGSQLTRGAFIHNDRRSLKCWDGYRNPDDENESRVYRCDNGNLNFVPRCEAKPCEMNMVGWTGPSEIAHGESINIECENDHRKVQNTVTCTTGTPNPLKPCETYCDLDRLVQSVNGYIKDRSNIMADYILKDQMVTVKCHNTDEMFRKWSQNSEWIKRRTPKASLKCMGNDNWGSAEYKCYAKCQATSYYPNVILPQGAISHGDTLNFQCNTGFSVANNVKCQNGILSKTPQCDEDPCTRPPEGWKGTFHIASGASQPIQCETSYLSTKQRIRCSKGSHNPQVPCKKFCQLTTLSDNTGAQIISSHSEDYVLQDSNVTIRCDWNSDLFYKNEESENWERHSIGTESLTCHGDNMWGAVKYKCFSKCIGINRPRNGYLVNNDPVSHQGTVNYGCNGEFASNTNPSICEDGQVKPAPDCVRENMCSTKQLLMTTNAILDDDDVSDSDGEVAQGSSVYISCNIATHDMFYQNHNPESWVKLEQTRSSVECLDNGWKVSVKCFAKCIMEQQPNNGYLDGMNTPLQVKHLENVPYACNDGFTKAPGNSVCNNGILEPTPSCTIQESGCLISDFRQTTNAEISPSKPDLRNQGQMIDISCLASETDLFYKRTETSDWEIFSSARASLQCKQNGWGQVRYYCFKKCSQDPFSNGYYSPSFVLIEHLSKVHYICFEPYRASSAVSICNNGTITPQPSCRKGDECALSDLLQATQGQLVHGSTIGSVNEDEFVDIRCGDQADLFEKVGENWVKYQMTHKTFTCTGAEAWDGKEIYKCFKKCTVLPAFDHGFYVSDSSDNNETVRYTCSSPGFHEQGPSKCLDGVISPRASCTPNTASCQAADVEHATLFINGTKWVSCTVPPSTIVTAECQVNYYNKNNKTIKCLPNGQWNETLSCRERKCFLPDVGLYTYNDEVNTWKAHGHSFHYDRCPIRSIKYSECVDGSWKPAICTDIQPATCGCHIPSHSKLLNTSYSQSGANSYVARKLSKYHNTNKTVYDMGAVIRVSCLGEDLVDREYSLKCLSPGRWNQTLKCASRHCIVPDKGEAMTFSYDSDSNYQPGRVIPDGESVYFHCKTHNRWTLAKCEKKEFSPYIPHCNGACQFSSSRNYRLFFQKDDRYFNSTQRATIGDGMTLTIRCPFGLQQTYGQCNNGYLTYRYPHCY